MGGSAVGITNLNSTQCGVGRDQLWFQTAWLRDLASVHKRFQPTITHVSQYCATH